MSPYVTSKGAVEEGTGGYREADKTKRKVPPMYADNPHLFAHTQDVFCLRIALMIIN